MTVPHELVIRPDAEVDLAEAYLWYENKAKRLGSEFLDSVDATLTIIEQYPNLYPEVYEHVRRALISRFPFAIFYLLDTDRIVILAILHAHVDPAAWPMQEGA